MNKHRKIRYWKS